MSTTTACPWMARPIVPSGFEIVREAAPVAGRIATVNTWNGLEEANATLIASAPELVIALKRAEVVLNNWCHDTHCEYRMTGTRGECDCNISEDLAAVRAALKKAGVL